MKNLKATTLAFGFLTSMVAVSAHADGYDAMAADRYSNISSGKIEIMEGAVAAHMQVVENMGFQPLSASRYNPILFSVSTATEAKQSANVDDSTGARFNPLSANRYHM